MTNTELEKAAFAVDGDCNLDENDTYQEWDWIVEHCSQNATYWEVVARIETNYAGRGPLSEVPKRSTINRGLRALLKAGVLKAV